MSDIQIIDNLLDDVDNQIIHDIMIGEEFPWYFNSKTIEKSYEHLNSPNVYEAPFLSHVFISQDKTNSDFSDLVFPILKKFKERIQHNNNNLNVNRIKANLYQKFIRSGKYNTPHIDSYEQHSVLLYFVNDCDGNTFLFKNKQLEILEEIIPKAGRAVFFDGSIYHASNHPINSDYRITLNFNFT